MPDVLPAEIEPDDEHEEDDADLAQKLQRAERVRGKNACEHAGRQGTHEGRAQRDARGHLANDRRLPEPARNGAKHARDGDHDDDLEQQARQGLGWKRQAGLF